VEFTQTTFALNKKKQAIAFLVYLYNLIPLIQANVEELRGANGRDKIHDRIKNTKDQKLPALYTKQLTKQLSPGHQPNKRPRPNDEGQPEGQPQHGREHVITNTVREALTDVGCEIDVGTDSDSDLDDWVSWHGQKVGRVRLSGGRVIVVKLVDHKGSELYIHKTLAGLSHPSNHTAPLEHMVSIPPWTILVMPYGTPLRDLGRTELAPRLARELLAGVGFMHSRGIAHLDLKPDNLVVAVENIRLLIVDFGLSCEVAGRGGKKVRGFRGTVGWVAPEVGDEKGPVLEFCPIAADLWATGRTLLYLTSFIHGVELVQTQEISRRLMCENASSRPSLDEYGNLIAFPHGSLERGCLESSDLPLKGTPLAYGYPTPPRSQFCMKPRAMV